MNINPGLLKLDLLCKGMRIDESSFIGKEARPIKRTRAGLGSGLEAVLAGGLHVNIPVVEDFAKKSPYILKKIEGRYFILKEDNIISGVKIPPKPCWYDFKTSRGITMSNIAVLQGTYLAVYPAKICEYWTAKPQVNCRFCSTGLNIGYSEEKDKSVQDVVDTAIAAKRESGITFIHFNTGYYSEGYTELLLPYIREVKKATGLLIGIQCPPEQNLAKYDILVKAGVDHFSFCFEFFNKNSFKEMCPGKDKTLGQDKFFAAIEYTSKLLGKGKVSGEIIAGLEPLEDTIKAIDYITSVGAFPTICVFRPLKGTVYENKPVPKYEDMLIVFRRMYEYCRDRFIPTGIAPNIKSSLVVLPYEGKYFRHKIGIKDLAYAIILHILRIVFGIYYNIRMKLFTNKACLKCKQFSGMV